MANYNFLPENMSILQGTSPAVTSFNGSIYLFYVGSGKEGIFYASCDVNKNWSNQQLCTSPVKGNPSVLTFNGKIFLFYVPENTTWINYQAFDGKTWTESQTIGHDATLLDPSSPAGVVYNNQLYVFWNGSGNDGIWYKVYDGKQFGGQIHCNAKDLALWQGTSPAPTVLLDKIYLFYNGSGHDGTWYVTFDGSKWSDAISMRGQTNSNFEIGTSPYAYGGMVMWSGSDPTGTEPNGTWFSSSWNGSDWTSARGLNDAIGRQDLMSGTNAVACDWNGNWICWAISGGTQIAQLNGF